jgi:hypothetical protein
VTTSSSNGSGAANPPAPRRPSLFKAPRLTVRDEPPIAPGGPPPRQVIIAAIALVVSGVFSIVAGASLYGERTWLTHSVKQSQKNDKPKDKLHGQALYDHVSTVMKGQLISGAVLAVVLSIIAFYTFKGRSWSRWAVVGVWLIATYSGQLAGIASVLSIGSSNPVAFKLPSFVAGLGMLIAVIGVNLRPSARYFSANRPPRPDRPGRPGRGGSTAAGQVPARPGLRDLFAPRTRPAPAARSTPSANSTKSASTSAGTSRSKAKVRVDSDAVAKGAELARNRAKTSKSRRTDS